MNLYNSENKLKAMISVYLGERSTKWTLYIETKFTFKYILEYFSYSEVSEVKQGYQFELIHA